MNFEYSRWDGTQTGFPFDADEIMKSLSDDLIADGDLWGALQRMMQWGYQAPDGQRMKGLQDLIEQVRARRQEELNSYDLGGAVDQIRQKLDQIVRQERAGIDRRLEQAGRGVPPEHLGQRPSRPEADPSAEGDADARSRAAGQGESEPSPSGATPTPDSPQTGESNGRAGGAAPDSLTRPDLSGLDPAALRRLLEKVAERKKGYLDGLPKDLGGLVRALSEYEFMDNDARDQFQELLKMLQQKMLESHVQGMQETIRNMSPEDLARMREMVQDLNKMLQERARGGSPDFQSFMDKHGQFFPGVESLNQLIEQMQRRLAQMRSLLDSMTPEMRKSLQSMFDALFQDDRLKWDLAKLAATLEQLMPMRQFRSRYPFAGDEPLTLGEAMKLMERLQELDQLEKSLRQARDGQPPGQADPEAVARLLGDEAARAFEQLQQISRVLEEAGYIQRCGNSFELTPRGIRKIGQKALTDIFAQLRRDRVGKHGTNYRGTGGDRTDDAKRYEFGDPFLLDLQKTVMNAVQRAGVGTPVELGASDFEVYRTELLTQCSTVLMLDMSRSMLLRGCFLAAKKVAMALNSLIRGQFPKDQLYVVGFSDYARELKADQLPQIDYNEYVYGTNLQHGLILARQMLARHKTTNKQVIVITDGEPTAHLENGRVYFNYPPTAQTIRETLIEVVHCTRENIVINTFMLERSVYLTEFVNQMARINRGRTFFASPERLGEYILVDYVSNKRRRIA